MDAISERREWFSKWLEGDNGQLGDEAIAKLKEPHLHRRMAAGYCRHGKPRLPFNVSYGVAAQKILGKHD